MIGLATRASLPRLLRFFSAALVLLVLFTVLQRVSYPFELEWLESVTLTHAARIATGKPLYTEPTLEWTPSVYAPLSYVLTAALAKIGISGFAAGRVMSIAAWLSTLLVLWWHFGRARWPDALLAAGLYAACFRLTEGFLDLARADSLLVAFLLAAILTLRSHAGKRAQIFAACWMAAACWSKQSALVFAVALWVWSVWRRRWLFAACLPPLLLLPAVWLHRQSDGWSTFYIFVLPLRLRAERGWNLDFLTHDLLLSLPVPLFLATASLWARRGRDHFRFDLMCVAAALLSGWIARLDPISFRNVLMPTYATLIWLAPHGLHSLNSRPRLGMAAQAALILQLAFGAFDPRGHVPSAADRLAGEELLLRLRQVHGPVLVPYHSYLPIQAGKPSHAHMSPMSDIMRSRDSALIDRFRQHLIARIQSGDYAAVVTDGNWMLHTVRENYRDGGAVFADSSTFLTMQGERMRPERYFWRPERHD